MAERVLVIGGGHGEQVFSTKLAQSGHVKQVFMAPGNAATPDTGKICNSAVLISNPAILKQFCKDHNIGLAVVNPISLLTAGIIDDLTAAGLRCFGPTGNASQLEANKCLAKDFMDRHGIPTARWKSFTNPHEACRFITYSDFPALVVKPNGLASGRDIHIANDKDGACRAVQHLTQDWTLGTQTEMFIVEERLEGKEFSCLAFTDGNSLAPMPLVRLRKGQIHQDENLQAAATGALRPTTKEIKDILQNIADAVKQEGWQYAGVIGARVMLTGEGPFILGLKCTFSDPDTQIILPLLKSDLYEVIEAAITRKLHSYSPEWARDGSAASAKRVGYPPGNETQCTDQGPESPHSGQHYIEVVTNGRRDLTSERGDLAPSSDVCGKGLCWDTRKNVGYYELNTALYKDPVFLCTTNSAGSKAKVAHVHDRHGLVSKEVVAVCMNDLLYRGADALFFMPHLARGRLQANVAEEISDGFATACKTAGVTLLAPWRATGWMSVAFCLKPERQSVDDPDTYPDGFYCLTGCAVGVMERRHRLPRMENMTEGDILIGVYSSAVHSSSVGIIRRIMDKHSLKYSSLLPLQNGDLTWGDLLLNPTKIYGAPLLPAVRSGCTRAFIPVTECGLKGSILKVLPDSIGFIVDALCWKIPSIFSWLYKEGDLSEEDMISSFNCGIGAVLIVQKNMSQHVLEEIQKEDEAWLIGALTHHCEGSSRGRVTHLPEALWMNMSQLSKKITANRPPARLRNVAVYICTAGAKLKQLIDSTRLPGSCTRLGLIISNKTTAGESKKAAGAGIPTRVIDQTFFGCHSEFEFTINKVLEEFSIDLVCFVGFRRTLSDQFVNKWKGKLLSAYPWLSPALSAERVLQTKLKVSGCTICFTLDGCAPGPTVLQETVTVQTGDTEVTLSARMEDAQQRAVTKALLLVASGIVSLPAGGSIYWRAQDRHQR